MIEKSELIEIAERCWQAACDADIGAGLRFQTYQQMLCVVLQREVEKESWQE